MGSGRTFNADWVDLTGERGWIEIRLEVKTGCADETVVSRPDGSSNRGPRRRDGQWSLPRRSAEPLEHRDGSRYARMDQNQAAAGMVLKPSSQSAPTATQGGFPPWIAHGSIFESVGSWPG